MQKINIVTLFPEVFESFLKLIPFKNLVNRGELEVNLVNLRDFGLGNYKKVDDEPYGGGPGMVLMIEPIYNALNSISSQNSTPAQNRTILLSPRGNRFTQKKAIELKDMEQLTLICGRYEGIDARVEELCDEVLSIGDFVMSGGEAAAICVLEAVVRLIPGALGDIESISDESFSPINGTDTGTTTEYPQFTRPENFKGMRVPEIMLSGNHKLIQEWREHNRQVKD